MNNYTVFPVHFVSLHFYNILFVRFAIIFEKVHFKIETSGFSIFLNESVTFNLRV